MWIAIIILGMVAWAATYSQLETASELVVSALPVPQDSRFAEAAHFFIYDTPKVFMLLAIVVFVMGMARRLLPPEIMRKHLTNKYAGAGNFLAACLGIFTPFCSCSAVSLFTGFVSAGVPLGATFSFLVAAPMINEVALGLLFGLVGWKVAAIYLAFGLAVATAAGAAIGAMKPERFLEDWVLRARSEAATPKAAKPTAKAVAVAGWTAMADIVGNVWPWMLTGIAVGAAIHGYVPSETLAAVMGKDAWWSPMAAVAMGVPIYSNAAGIIPIVDALLGKGAALGTVLAFMMAVTALSLPEAIILRRVMKPRLLAAFFGIVALGILLVGFMFNFLV